MLLSMKRALLSLITLTYLSVADASFFSTPRNQLPTFFVSPRSPQSLSASAYTSNSLYASSSDQPSRLSASLLDSADGKALRGYVRGHKCLFDDQHLRSGSIIFLTRGADSSQRYIYPLELKTNQHELPGADAASVMFEKRDSILSEVMKEGDDPILGEELQRYHRVLQYAVASGQTHFMRKEVLEYIEELYHEIGFDIDALANKVELLNQYYKPLMSDDGYTILTHCTASLKEALLAMKQATPPTPRSSPPSVWERDAEPGTMFPLNRVDVYSLNINEVPEAERAEVSAIVEHVKSKYPLPVST
eukprot:GHVN01006484.1.p1 GENE.GHVN01006484.1~~GHVN01006484.1.p1  ORF type:complete len:305 (-),score=65.59 GHVN01006484.1:150-1064(-)